jgi:hypothetical protein
VKQVTLCQSILNQLETITLEDKVRMSLVTFNKEDFQCIDFSAVYFNKRSNLNTRSKSQIKMPKSDLNLDAPVFSPRNKDYYDFSAGNYTQFSTTIS